MSLHDRFKESLSALLDGEVNELELQRLLAHENRQQVSLCWQRYHALSIHLHQESSLRVSIDVRAAVMDAIQKDDTPTKA